MAAPLRELSLAEAGDITRRASVTAPPESTVGGDTTCIVCFTNPKTHMAVPCGHQCACDACAAQMKQCPYCREDVLTWFDSQRHRKV